MTTCSAWISCPDSRRTVHVSSGRCSKPTTIWCWWTSAPASWADFTYAHVTPVGSTCPSTGSNSAPTKYCGSRSGKTSRASLALISSRLHPEVPAARLGHPQEVHPDLGVGEHQATGQVDRAVLAGDPLDLLVQLDRVLLEPRDVGIAVERVHPAGRVPGAAGGELATLEQHHVGPAGLREVIEDARPDHAPTDDDDLRG